MGLKNAMLPMKSVFINVKKGINELGASLHSTSLHCIAYDYSRVDRDSLCDHLRDVPWEDL